MDILCRLLEAVRPDGLRNHQVGECLALMGTPKQLSLVIAGFAVPAAVWVLAAPILTYIWYCHSGVVVYLVVCTDLSLWL